MMAGMMQPLLFIIILSLISVRLSGARSYALGGRPIVIAHRGSRGSSGDMVESTKSAYWKGCSDGADYLECDLQLTRDGIGVCSHDAVIDRTTDLRESALVPARTRTDFLDGQKIEGNFLVDFDWEELRQIPAVRRGNVQRPPRREAQEEADRVASFAEFVSIAQECSELQGRPVGIYVELKHPSWYMYRRGADVAQVLLEELDKGGYLSGSPQPTDTPSATTANNSGYEDFNANNNAGNNNSNSSNNDAVSQDKFPLVYVQSFELIALQRFRDKQLQRAPWVHIPVVALLWPPVPSGDVAGFMVEGSVNECTADGGLDAVVDLGSTRGSSGENYNNGSSSNKDHNDPRFSFNASSSSSSSQAKAASLRPHGISAPSWYQRSAGGSGSNETHEEHVARCTDEPTFSPGVSDTLTQPRPKVGRCYIATTHCLPTRVPVRFDELAKVVDGIGPSKRVLAPVVAATRRRSTESTPFGFIHVRTRLVRSLANPMKVAPYVVERMNE
eukprot:GHVU01113873.1.p1 GENE.GHVU01113873.1~~GHVU01113873.1.p1  ORF type:complete len:502 (+),score=63.90 GHVU01113873.1:378-1883(+)